MEIEYGRMRWVGPVPCMGEEYREGCGVETGRRICGRRTTKCGIILKFKKYKMRAWTGFMCRKIRTVEAFYSALQ